MKILMAASESVPFVKVGGLADVVGTLPSFLKQAGHDVKIIIPKYQKIDSNKYNLKSLPYRLLIPVGDNLEEVTLKEGFGYGDVPVYFIENAKYFHRPEVYSTPAGDYPDNRERFILFSRAVLEAAKAIDFQPDIIHCHDWQTGIIPAYLKTVYQTDAFFCKTTTVYTIHNIAYQGFFEADTVKTAGFQQKDFTWDKLEYYGKFNFMKAGLVYADKLSTVSPSYAKEILLPENGRGMEGVLETRVKDLFGILNGIDKNEWNPETDIKIASTFSKDRLEGKIKCKEDLQKECGLPVKNKTFVIGAVSRLDPQKGYDLVAKVLPKILESYDVQLIILGSGNEKLQDMISKLSKKFPSKMKISFDFNNNLAHKIYAGADLFLMPSRFEPCGLGQMIAMSYGTIPLVHKTGGLADTVENFNGKTYTGNGFVFDNARESELKNTIERALGFFYKDHIWSKLVYNAVASDFSWNKSVKEYLGLYQEARHNTKMYLNRF